jgi:diguanylate cyclase (GGDEF)-like protein
MSFNSVHGSRNTPPLAAQFTEANGRPRSAVDGGGLARLKRVVPGADSQGRVRGRDRNSLSDQLAAAQQRIGELESTLSQLEQRDPITRSLLTLRAFRTQLELDVARADRYQRPLSVAVLDIDGFRRLNVEHGYAAGDAVLALLGHLIAKRTRMNDLACRMGGDEFAILFNETDAGDALEAVQRILIELEQIEAGGVRVSRGSSPASARRRCWPRRARRWSWHGPRAAARPPCSPQARARLVRTRPIWAAEA